MQHISTKVIYDQTLQGVKSDPPGIMQGIKILPINQIRIQQEERDAQYSFGFWNMSRTSNPG